LHPVPATASEHEELARERILAQLQLHDCGKPIEALAHIRHATDDPDLRSGGKPDHRRCASAASTVVSCSIETSPTSRTRTLSGHSISIVPVAGGLAELTGSATLTGSSFTARGCGVRFSSTPCWY